MQELLKTIIIEDTNDDIDLLTRSIEICFEKRKRIIDLHTIARSYEEAKEIIESGEQFDLSILDINLKDKEVFDLIDELGVKSFGIIALTTRNKQNLDKVIKLSPLFIKKPFSPYVLNLFFDELEKKIRDTITPSIIEKMTPLTNDAEVITINAGKKILKIPYENILFIQGNRNVPSIVYVDSNMNHEFIPALDTTLEKLYAELDKTIFQQSQKSYIINLSKIVGCNQMDKTLFFAFTSKLPVAQFSYSFPNFIKHLESKGFI